MKLKGTLSVYSNSPYAPTGYGCQMAHLIPKLKSLGLDVAVQSNYGLEGALQELDTPHGKVPHFPRGMDAYSNDAIKQDHRYWIAKNAADQKNLWLSLYDVWVLDPAIDFPVASWVPLDHQTMPPRVEAWLRKENVTPIAMAPNGIKQMNDKGIECEYAPHAIDTKVFKPTHEIAGKTVNEFMNISEDTFLVGMVAANKSSGQIHRKAFSENLLAFSIFYKEHPDAVLYLHTDPVCPFGWNLLKILQAVGLPEKAVIFPSPTDYRYGMPQEALAALYSRFDVLLAPSFGEGFGVPQMEAMACGTRVIGSSWAASEHLLSPDSWMVQGQPLYDSGQDAWWSVPQVPSIVAALEEAYKAERGTSSIAVQHAKQFDVEKVWSKHWVPILSKLLK